MPSPDDEFSYLEQEAAEFGILTPLQTPHRAAVIDPDGYDLSAIVWGQHPSATYLHGAGLNAHTWDATIAELGTAAIAVDLPGHGDSSWRRDRDYRASRNAGAVASVLDALGAGPQLVVGQSLGGGTAIALAAQRPDLVTGLVVVDFSPGLTSDAAEQVTGFLAGPQVFSSREEIAERAIAFGFGASRAALDRGIVLNTRVRDDGSVIFKHQLTNLEPGETVQLQDFETLWADLGRITVPILLVHAEHGFLSAAVVDDFLSRVPGATGVQIDTGHNVQEEKPVELAAIIRSFAESIAR